MFPLGPAVCFINVHAKSFRLAGPLALIMAKVTALIDYEVRTSTVFGTAALSVAHWAVLHQLQDGLFVNYVLQRRSVTGEKRYDTQVVWSWHEADTQISPWIHFCRSNGGKQYAASQSSHFKLHHLLGTLERKCHVIICNRFNIFMGRRFFCWSQSQLSQGEGRVHLGRVASSSQGRH